MVLTSFCGLVTLQVGTAILAAVFFTVAGATLAANTFDYYSETLWFPYSFIFLLIFVIALIIAGSLMFASSYRESRNLAIMAVIVIVILIFYWLILCAFSFLSDPDHVRGVCISARCPETFWLGNLDYRRQYIDGEKQVERNSEDGGSTSNQKRKRWMEQSTEVFYRNYLTTRHRTGFKLKLGKEHRKQISKYRNVEIRKTKPFEAQRETKRDQQTNEGHEGEIANDRGYFEVKEGLGTVSLITSGNHSSNSMSNNLQQYTRGDEDADNVSKNYYSNYHSDDNDIIWANVVAESHDNATTMINPERKEVDNEEKQSRYVCGYTMVGAIMLFIKNLIFFLFAAFEMYSWAQELFWKDHYYYYYNGDDDSVDIVEEY